MTAVGWLEDKLDVIIELDSNKWDKIAELVAKAKEMEKQQIMEAFDNGDHCIDLPDGGFEQKYKSAKQYYNETYNK